MQSSTLKYKKNSLHFGEISLNKLSQKYKTPFYLYDQKNLEQSYKTFENSVRKSGINKSTVCFALKANPNLALLKILKRLGCGADVVSGGELERAILAKISPSNIVFSGVGKTEEEIELALKYNIKSINVESASELDLIYRLSKKSKNVPNIAFRLNPKVESKTHKHISTGGELHKFGLFKEEILTLIETKKYWKKMNLVGLSMHIGSQLTCLEATKNGLRELKELLDKCPYELDFLDVGGGLGISYLEEDKKSLSSLDEYMNCVYKELSGLIENGLEIIFEPGRYIVATSGIIVSKVIRSKSNGYKKFIIIDCGMNDFARTALYEAYHEILPVKKSDIKTTCDVVGPICESSDFFARNISLPNLNEGDVVVIDDVGAYGRSMSSQYNLREIPSEFLIKEDLRILKI